MTYDEYILLSDAYCLLDQMLDQVIKPEPGRVQSLRRRVVECIDKIKPALIAAETTLPIARCSQCGELISGCNCTDV